MRSLILFALFLAASPARAAVYIVRHAEKAQAEMTQDPPLTKAGRKRAQALARVLRSVALKAVYATEFRRTRQTAEPAAKAHGLKISKVKSNETGKLAAALRAGRPQDDVLVVAHSDTIPDLLKALGVPGGPKEELASNDYDNLFVVDLSSAGARLHWLHYGLPNP